MANDERAPVAIVGGGFSGTMAAAQLARRGIDSILVEATERTGLGAAYSTLDPAHLLNIRAEDMGAWAGAPQEFAESQGVERASYAERRQFGRYLRSILDKAVETGSVRMVRGRAVAASRQDGSWTIRLEQGVTIRCEALVLAIGNQPPASPVALEAVGDLLIADPWGERAREAIADAAARQDDVLILGASLTMIDVALSLDGAGHRGRVLAVSRRGKIPLSQGRDDSAPIEWEEVPEPRVREIARWLRRRSAEVGWRAAVDSLRPYSHRLWQSLPIDEKRRFLRLGRPWWDIHRHRIAPEVAARIDGLVRECRLEVVAGRLWSLEREGDRVKARIRRRGRDEPEPERSFAYVFNCTGPLHDIARTRDPLIRQMMDDGLAVPDELGIGLSVDGHARVAGSERLWALGALTKGRYWEMIAVPDIREQAAEVADDIETELST